MALPTNPHSATRRTRRLVSRPLRLVINKRAQVGDDGLTDAQRRAEARRYEATMRAMAWRGSREELIALAGERQTPRA